MQDNSNQWALAERERMAAAGAEPDTMSTLTDRQGRDITCAHSGHYESDALPTCKGQECKGQTVACGQGLVDCRRHASYSYRIEQGTTTVADEPTWAVVQYRDGVPQGADAHWVRLRYAERAMAIYERRPELHGQPSSVLREAGLVTDPDAPDPDARYSHTEPGHFHAELASTLQRDRAGWTSVYDAELDRFYVTSPYGWSRTYRRVS